MSVSIELVARAIFEAKWGPELDADELSSRGTPNWKQYEDDAIAAIKAMNPHMIDEALK
jgi:hypothetical protein